MKLYEFNWRRFWAIIGKEFIQMRRDRLTFVMMVGIPLLQLVLFGYAINSDPKHLPTAVYSADNSVFSRTIVWGLRNSSYFDVVREPKNEADIQNCSPRARSSSPCKFRWIFPGNCCAARNRICCWKPTPPIPRPSAMPMRAVNPAGDHRAEPRPHRTAGRPARRTAAVQSRRAPALQSGKHHPV